MWKQWKIIKPSPQKVVAVTCKRFQLQGFNWKIWCFGSVVAYGRWSFVRVGHTWRFDCTSMTKFLTSSQKQLLARQSWFLVLFSPPYITKSYSKLLIMLPVKENFNVVVLKSFFSNLFHLNSGTTTRRFIGHTKDVLSVAFSADNRQIVSGSRDKTIKLWNTLGVCKYTIQVLHWISKMLFLQ